jgi:hypothetical protein
MDVNLAIKVCLFVGKVSASVMFGRVIRTTNGSVSGNKLFVLSVNHPLIFVNL